MKILIINKFYYLRGGTEKYFFEVGKLLQNKGHKVYPFSMKHIRNEPSEHAKYFVSNIDFQSTNGSYLKRFKSVFRTIYSTEAQNKLTQLIKVEKPDIAHLNTYCYHLTPSILYALKEAGIPVVHTTHEYKYLCPNQRLFNMYSGEICEDCKGEKYYYAVINRCIKNSYASSLIGCTEAYLFRFSGIYNKAINFIISPSKFMKNKMVEYGLNSANIEYIPNFIEIPNYIPRYSPGEYILYFGGLIANKGIHTLLKAMKRRTNIQLKIAGEGEIKEDLEGFVSKENISNVCFVGYKSGDELQELLRKCLFTVLPSEMYENCPYAVLESFALGKPVIGARIGGIPELIDNGRDGLLFEPMNVDDLTEKIDYLANNKELVVEMGKMARRKVEERYNSDLHYERLMEVYKQVLTTRRMN